MFQIVQRENSRFLPWRGMRAAARWMHHLSSAGKERWDPGYLGWGLIAPENVDPIYMVVLRGLLEHRHATVYARGGKLNIYHYRKGEDPETFLQRNGFTNASAPYYLLILGSKAFVPGALEMKLKGGHAVGRLDFGIPEEFLHYSRSLVKAETGRVRVEHGVTLLNHREEGIRVANELLEKQEQSPHRWMIAEMASQSIDHWEALTLHLTPSGKKAEKRARLVETPDLRGHLVFQVGCNDEDPSELEGGFARSFHWRDLLSRPTGAASAMVRFDRQHAVSLLGNGLPGVLDGLPLGAAFARPIGGHAPSFSIYGDPAARLAHFK